MDQVRIMHFSDALCVWAYVAEVRCDELLSRFPGQVSLDCHYLQVFGDVRTKIIDGWKDRGGVEGYAAHVRSVAEGFPHVEVHPEVWLRNTPTSSLPAHLLLCGVRALEQTGQVAPGLARQAAWAVREAFFRDGEDISRFAVLIETAERSGVPAAKIEPLLADGRAHAALSTDLDSMRSLDIRASPTLLFNEARQRLTGNVGYRIIEANVRELLENPKGESSWC